MMRDNSTLRPNRLAQWVVLVASAIPAAIGIVDVLTVSGPGDQKMSAGMGLAFLFVPLSFLFAVAGALMTFVRWRGATRSDRIMGLVPLLFPPLAVVLASCF